MDKETISLLMILLSKYTFLNITFFSFQFLQIFEEFARIGKKVNSYNLHILHKSLVISLHQHCLN